MDMHALVVDDSRTTRLILKQILIQLGFEVEVAGNGREGLAQLKQSAQTNLVLVDWNMPDMDGLSFVRAVRADADFRDIRLLMVSGEESASQVATALAAGADAFVRKPFTRETILEKLELLRIGQG
jgi:two-component system chemotaxis response regulator CheY